MLGDEFGELLAGARAGDEDAFAALWREVQPGLLRYLRVVDSSGAEDIAAETWVNVTRGLGRFSGHEGGFRAWVFTIARRRLLDAHRAAGRRPRASEDERGLSEIAGGDDPAHLLQQDLSTERALALIAALPPDQAEVVALRGVADLDVDQVAKLVRKRPGTVRVLAHRGLRRLAEILGDRREL
ncbi:MAG TPA: sigma-70 family RNA polymerase sigma factor [Acidimicrobiia bacterium]|nr:sigma-70 family RNA polymerase sigma factor [Acidimicrobiia bacterium]